MAMSLRRMQIRLLIVTVLLMLSAQAGAIGLARVQAGPISDAATFVATNIERGGAEIALTAGKFVQDSTTGVVEVIDEAGIVTERIVPKVLVNGVVHTLTLIVREGGRKLEVAVHDALVEGAKVAAAQVDRSGRAAEACLNKGLPAAIMPGIIAALSGGLLAAASADPIGIVTAAAVAGLAGAWRGFVEGCTEGVATLPAAPAQSAHPAQLQQVRP
ncbi:hypothetical protein [Nocardia sp. NPDC051570]|uniref:hypothetical protein n=1 Tax=Nocardia sp. NPDC051570 TaxID=3364324 RepID=UPI0037A0FDF5